jgi:hypothetical protein
MSLLQRIDEGGSALSAAAANDGSASGRVFWIVLV